MLSETEGDFLTLHEFVKAAKGKLSPGTWDYLVGATETETTMLRNRQALDSLAFRPRVLRDVSTLDTSIPFFDRKLALPVMLAPVGGLESFDPEGGAPAARAAAKFGVPTMVSSVTHPGMEAMAEAAGQGPRVYQLYVRGDAAWMDEVVKRAVDNGYDAFCLTVDTAIYSRRERDIAKRFVKPWRARAMGVEFQAALNWDDVKRFKDRHRIPLALKGIATAEDAAIACEHGVEVVYVSNHGGRQLDHGRGAHRRAAGGGARRRRPRQGLDRRRLQPRQRHRQGDRARRQPGRDRPALLLRADGGGRGGRHPDAGTSGNGVARGAGPSRRDRLRRARPVLRPRGDAGGAAECPQRLPADEPFRRGLSLIADREVAETAA